MSIIGTVVSSRWVSNAKYRRGVGAGLALVLAFLSVWPRPYVASALLAPDDSAAALTGLFSGGAGVNLVSSLLGGRGSIEADLLVGRSNAVFTDVAQQLQQHGRFQGINPESLKAKLHRKIEVESERGSILKVSYKDHDPELARQIVDNFVKVLRSRLTTLSRDQAVEKRGIASRRMEEATRLYEAAQQALVAYRATHNFSTPEIQQGFSQGALAGLQGQLQGAQSTIALLEKTQGPDNIQLQNARDRVAVLQRQIADLETRGGTGSVQSLAKVNPEIAQYRNLLRNEGFAQGRYDIYKRYLESLTVQEVAAPLNLAIIDPPFIEPQRQYNAVPLGLLALLIVLAALAEFYIVGRPKPVLPPRQTAEDHRDI